MLWTDPVVASQQPSIEVSEHDMDHWQMGFGLCLVALDGQWIVAVAKRGEVVVASPAISADNGIRGYRRENEMLQLFLATPLRDLEAEPSGNNTATVPTPVFGLRLPGRHVRVGSRSLRTRPHLHRADDQRLVVASPALTLRGAAHPRFVQLDRPFSTDSVSLRANHRSPQFVKHLKRCFVASEAELTLELQSTHTGSLCCDKIGRPEPDAQRLPRTVHDCAGCEAELVAAMTTFEHTRARR